MVSARRILAILVKDLRDAGRDGRIILLLLLPIGAAVFQNVTFQDPQELPVETVAIVDPGGGASVATALRAAAGKSVKLELRRTRDAASARALVAKDDVAVAVVVAPEARRGPVRAEVLVTERPSPAAQAVVALLPDALARAAGREPAAVTNVRTVAATDVRPDEIIGQRAVIVLLGIVMSVVFVAMMVVPIQMAEELETGTLGALRLAATGSEILAAKAAAGLIYGSAGVGLTVVLTDLSPADPLVFFGAALALIVSLVGFGLLMGLLWPNSTSINAYAGFFLVPLIGLSAIALFVESGILATICELLPFSQATRLLGDGLSSQSPFDTGPGSWAVIAVWGIVGYAILARIASRREL